MKNVTKWHQRFIGVACEVAGWSKDRSTAVGAVVVRDGRILTTGFNGFPAGVDDDVDARHERPAKYLFTVHAELNALLQAAREGTSLKGATLYLNCAPTPCANCAAAIIQAGVTRIVGNERKFAGKGPQWDESIRAAEEMLNEAGIERIAIEEPQ